MLNASAASSEEFWNWFSSVHNEYRSLDTTENKEKLLDEMLTHLHAYDSGLCFEVSEPLEDGTNELIISAGGVLSKFSKVRELVAAAPEIENWLVIAFRPPLGFTFVHDAGDVVIDPKELWFLPLESKKNPEHLGLRIGYSEYKEEQKRVIRNAVWIILDTGIGEVTTAKKVKYLEVVELPDIPEDYGYTPLLELPAYLEWLEQQEG